MPIFLVLSQNHMKVWHKNRSKKRKNLFNMPIYTIVRRENIRFKTELYGVDRCIPLC